MSEVYDGAEIPEVPGAADPCDAAGPVLRLRRRTALLLLAALGAAAFLVLFLFFDPIAQPEAYHQFADRRALGGLPNALDVLSNLPFVLVGIVGLRFCARTGARPDGAFATNWERRAFTVVFGSLVLVAFGSAYYHWEPTTPRLFWDRVPIMVALTALLAITIGERIDPRAGRALFLPLVLGGLGSAAIWRATADLRLYVLVQGFTIVALPLLYATRPPRYTGAGALWWMVGLYGAAKLAELGDRAIFSLGGVVSGHTLKHLLAGAAVAQLLPHLRRRRVTVSS